MNSAVGGGLAGRAAAARLRSVPMPRAGDALAGVSVALVLIPQSLAYASVAGLPPERGLLAAILPPLAGALFASSRYLQTGPTAITSLLTYGALSVVATPGSATFITLAALLAALVGVIRFGIGRLRLGSVAYLMSPTVVAGFTSAAAILIIASQVPAALGVRAREVNPLASAAAAVLDPAGWSLPALAITLGTVLIVLGARRLSPLLPGALVALVGPALLTRVVDYPAAVVGPMAPLFVVDLAIEPSALAPLVLPALVIALVGFAEPASIARRYAAADREPWDPNREFVGQGMANLAAGLSGGFPVGGSFSRTALARLAGAKSRWAGVLTTVAVIALLPFVGLLESLPTAALAGVVIAAVVWLVDPRGLAFYYRASRAQFGIALVSFTATLAFAPHVEYGVVLGVVAAVGVHLWRENPVHATAWLAGTDLHLRPHGVLYFGSAPRLEVTLLRRLSEHPTAHRLVVHLDGLGRIDVSGAMVLRQLLLDARDAGLEVEVSDVPPQSVRIITGVVGDVAPIAAIHRPPGPDPGRELRL